MRTDMNHNNWILNERAYAGEEHLDTDYVAGYERKAQTDPGEEVTLLRSLGLNDASTVVDIGAGTGTFALAIAPYCRRVIAVDVSPAMLTALKANVEQSGIKNVECVLGGFFEYEHQGEPADVVYCRHVLHHLPDFWKALALNRIADLLKPGGILRLRDLVYSFDPGEAETILEAWFAGAASSSDKGWTRDELETHVRQEYSTYSWLLEPMLERAGLKIQQAQYTPSKIYAAYICVKS